MVYHSMAEKKVPHHDLRVIRSTFATTAGLRVTRSALQGAAALGYGAREIVAVI
jgi:hypothetical protein